MFNVGPPKSRSKKCVTDLHVMCNALNNKEGGAKQLIGVYGRSCARLRKSERIRRLSMRSPSTRNREKPVYVPLVDNPAVRRRRPSLGLQWAAVPRTVPPRWEDRRTMEFY